MEVRGGTEYGNEVLKNSSSAHCESCFTN